MAPLKMHELYAERMLARHDYGYAFYEPPSNQQVFSGMIGYVDAQGLWNPILDVTNKESIMKLGLKPPEALPERAPNETGIEWGPKYAENTWAKKLDLSAGVDGLGLGLPVGVSCAFEIGSSADNGAVLLTEPTIWREGFYHSHEFEVWVKQNSDALLKIRPEIKERGLWVVKWTYTTAACSINAWLSKSRSITVGFETNLVPVGELGPKGHWSESSSDGGWAHFRARDGDRRVVFMGGLYFRWRRLAVSGQHLKPGQSARPGRVFRSSSNQAVEKVQVDNEDFELTTEHIGKLDIEPAKNENDDDEEVF